MDLIQQWRLSHPLDLAIVTPRQSYTWQQLDEQIDSLVSLLKAQGVTKESVIALVGKNHINGVLLYLASLRLGALCALMPPQPKVAIAQKLDIIDADFLWLSDEVSSLNAQDFQVSSLSLDPFLNIDSVECLDFLDRVELRGYQRSITSLSHQKTLHQESLQREPFHRDQLASIVFTSGSTGTPKAVVHAVKHHIASAEGLLAKFRFEQADTWLLSLPIYHVSGLSIIWRWMMKGARLMVGEGHLSAEIQQVTHASLVPLQLQRLLESKQALPLKRVLLGGSHIPMPLIEQAKQRGIDCWVGYGMTETASTVIAKPVDESPTAGWLLPQRKIKLEQGRIYVAGDTLAAGYLLKGQLTPLVTQQQPWFDTKDLGRSYQQIGKPEEFVIIGRADNQFISGGENIHCEEIEAVLNRHPSIKQALVIAVDDKQYGKRPVAFVDLEGEVDRDSEMPLDAQAYQHFLERYLEKFKCPDAYYLLPASLLSTGIKISRAELVQYYQQHHA